MLLILILVKILTSFVLGKFKEFVSKFEDKPKVRLNCFLVMRTHLKITGVV